VRELKGLTTRTQSLDTMSDATKVVLGTVGVAALASLAVIAVLVA
jgi:hypothetical protein